jgi:hypothetical protein
LVVLGLFCDTSASAASQFKRPAFYAVGMEPQVVIAADFNHDGKLDLALLISLLRM